MIFSREVYFEGPPPSIDEIVERVTQRTGLQVTYLTDKWLLTNPVDKDDIFSLYQDKENTITLTNDGPITDLLRATLYTLIEMGGYYADWNA